VVAVAVAIVIGAVIGGIIVGTTLKKLFDERHQQATKALEEELTLLRQKLNTYVERFGREAIDMLERQFPRAGVPGSRDTGITQERLKIVLERLGGEFDPPVSLPPGNLDDDAIWRFVLELLRAKQQQVGDGLVEVAGDRATRLRERLALGQDAEALRDLDRILELLGNVTGVLWTVGGKK